MSDRATPPILSEDADSMPERMPEPVAEHAIVPTHVTEIERSTRRLMIIGALFLIFGIGGLGTWAALAPLQSAALASGFIKVSSERKTVQHLEGGIIKAILVKEGDKVKAGQVLVRLDDVTARARVDLLQGRLDRRLATLARLHAEQAGQDEIKYPQELLERSDKPLVSRLIEVETEVFDSRREAMAGEIGVMEQRIRQYHEQIEGLKTQIQSTRVQLATIREERDAASILYKKGIYEKPRYLALKRNMARLEGQIGARRSSIAQVEERIAEVRLRMIELGKERREEIARELRTVESEIFDTRERLRSARDTLERQEIRAPQDGTVVGLKFHTVGGVILGGRSILDIVPRGDVLVVEASLRPEDIDIVHEGINAEVRLTAFNRRTTPALPGKVTRVSADRFVNDQGSQAYYQVRVEIDPEHTSDLDLYPGMPAEVYLLTGKQTALAYFLKPLEDSIRRGLLEE